MSKKALIGLVIVLAAVALILLFYKIAPAPLENGDNLNTPPVENTDTSSGGDTNTGDTSGAGSTLPVGGTTLNAKVGETILFSEVSGKVTEVVEDSRCPKDTQCIWAGTVRVKVHFTFGTLSQDVTLKLGEPVTF